MGIIKKMMKTIFMVRNKFVRKPLIKPIPNFRSPFLQKLFCVGNMFHSGQVLHFLQTIKIGTVKTNLRVFIFQ